MSSGEDVIGVQALVREMMAATSITSTSQPLATPSLICACRQVVISGSSCQLLATHHQYVLVQS
jgi:hypothetical protein